MLAGSSRNCALFCFFLTCLQMTCICSLVFTFTKLLFCRCHTKQKTALWLLKWKKIAPLLFSTATCCFSIRRLRMQPHALRAAWRRVIVLFGTSDETVAKQKKRRSRCCFSSFILLVHSFFKNGSRIFPCKWTKSHTYERNSICVAVASVWQHNHNLQAFWQAHLFCCVWFFSERRRREKRKVFYYFWHFSHNASAINMRLFQVGLQPLCFCSLAC